MYFFKDTDGNWIVGSTPYSVKSQGGSLAPDFNSGASGNYTKVTISLSDGNATFNNQTITSIKKDAAGNQYANFAEFYTAVKSFFFRVGGTSMVSGYLLFPDSGTGRYFRIGVRANQLMQDKELTATGFTGVEGTDWENVTGAL